MDNRDYLRISKEKYLDKTTAGFLGQLVGFFSGYEFVFNSDKTARVAMPDDWFEMCNGPYANPNPHKKHQDKLLFNEESGLWEAWMDDDYSIDILNLYILRDMYAQYGTVVSKVITDAWVKYDVYDMGGGNRRAGAYALMKNHKYLPYFAGAWEFGNRFSYCYEPCIENETLGMVAAGMPSTAAYLADIFANVTSDQDPVIWTRFLCVMYSLAYFESDIPTVIRKAQQVLPKHSFTYSVVDGVFELYEKYPNDWRSAVVEAEKRFKLAHDRMVKDTMLEPNVNTSFVLLAMLYGKGDYRKTCKIVSLAGYDGDSTGAICMGLMGVIDGMKTLPKEANEMLWQDGKGVIVNLPYINSDEKYWMCMLNLPREMKITDIVDLYRQNFESILLEHGGKIDSENYYIPKQVLGTAESVYYEDFENGGFANYIVCGEAEIISNAFEGNCTAKLLYGSMYTEISGLCEGKQYRITAYINTSEEATAHLFIRDKNGNSTTASVCREPKYIRRCMVFTATEEKMDLGMSLSGLGFATLDHITVSRIEETPISHNVKVDGNRIKIEGSAKQEVLLKVTFANTSDHTVDAAVTVNGEDFNTVPFYKTAEYSGGASDAVYIPILLSREVNEVVLDTGEEKNEIIKAECVAVCELF